MHTLHITGWIGTHKFWFPKVPSLRILIHRKPGAEAANTDDNSSLPKEIILKVYQQLKSNGNVSLEDLFAMSHVTIDKCI